MTTWSGPDSNTGHLKIGVNVTTSDSTPAYGESITITCNWYVETVNWSYSDNVTLNWQFAGSSGSVGIAMDLGTNQSKLFLTKTHTYTAGSSSIPVAAGGSVSGVYDSANPSLSNTTRYTIPATSGVPDAPSQSAVSAITTSSAQMNWSLGGTHGTAITGQQIQWSSVSNFSSVIGQDSTISAGATNSGGALHYGLTPGSTYYCRVRSNSAAGYSAWSNTVSFVAAIAAPSALSGVTLTDSGGTVAGVTKSGVKVAWTPGAGNGASTIRYDTLVSPHSNAGAPYSCLSNSALTGGGAAITALPVQSVPVALSIGDTVTLVSGANVQTFILTAAQAAIGTPVSLAVQSESPNFSYPSGSTVWIGSFLLGDTASPQQIGGANDAASGPVGAGILPGTTYSGWARTTWSSPAGSPSAWVAAASTVTTAAAGNTGDLVDRLRAAFQQVGTDVNLIWTGSLTNAPSTGVTGKFQIGKTVILWGNTNVSISAAVSGSAAVSWGLTFASAPTVITTANSNSTTYLTGTGGNSSTGITLLAFHKDNTTSTATINVAWVAIGHI